MRYSMVQRRARRCNRLHDMAARVDGTALGLEAARPPWLLRDFMQAAQTQSGGMRCFDVTGDALCWNVSARQGVYSVLS